MNLEQCIINMLVSGKEEYDLYRSYIEPQNFDTNISKIIKLVDRMYERGSSNISCEEIKLLFKSEYPSMKEDVLRLIFDTLDTIYALNVSKEIHIILFYNFIIFILIDNCLRLFKSRCI